MVSRTLCREFILALANTDFTIIIQPMLKENLKKILVLGTPLLASQFADYLLQLADTIMVGKLGTKPLAAIAIAVLLTGIFFVLVWPVTVGTQTLASRRYGKQTENVNLAPETGIVLIQSFVVSIIFGIGSFILAFFSKSLLALLLKDKTLITLAISYINILKWVLPVAGLYASVTGFLAAINRTTIIMIATIGANILNVFFNYILIFGKFGFPAMGIGGAALGTVLAQSLGFIYLISYIAFSPTMKQYHCFRKPNLNRNIIIGIVKASTPIMAQNFVALLIYLVYESIIGNIGALYLAATHIVFSLFRINKTIVGGFARGTSILVGNALGRNEKHRAVTLTLTCELIALVIGLVVVTLTLSMPATIVKIFNRDPRTVTMGIRALYFFAAFFFVEIMGFSFEIIFANNGWGRYVLFSEFTTNMLFILGATLLFTRVFNMGIEGAWFGFALYQVFHALILSIGFVSKRWLHIEVETT